MLLRGSSNIAAIAGRSVAAVICLFLFATLSMGQVTTGTISGSVKDPSGAVVAGATVTANEAEKGMTRTVETNGSGEFVFPSLPSGK
jgi:hypothetical protein